MARKLSPARSLNPLSRKTQVDLGCRPSDVGGLDLAKVRLHRGYAPQFAHHEARQASATLTGAPRKRALRSRFVSCTETFANRSGAETNRWLVSSAMRRTATSLNGGPAPVSNRTTSRCTANGLASSRGSSLLVRFGKMGLSGEEIRQPAHGRGGDCQQTTQN